MKKNKKTLMACTILACTILFLFSGSLKASAKTMTLKAGKAKTYSVKKGKTYYAKFKAAKTGYMTVVTSNTKYVTLINAKHKKVGSCQEGNLELTFPTSSNKASGYAHPAAFGVKKGKVYYLKLTSNFSGSSKVKILNTKCRAYAANKKSKAYKLSKDKKLTSAVMAGKKKTWWFKYKTTTDYRNLMVEFNSSHVVEALYGTKADNCEYKVQMYDASGKELGSETTKYNTYLYDYKFFGPAGSKGSTIYIKVTALSKYNSGWFYVKAKDSEN